MASSEKNDAAVGLEGRPIMVRPNIGIPLRTALRAWCYLVWLSWQRQARAHLMVWIALGLLAFMVFLVAILTPTAWNIRHWRAPGFRGLAHGHMAYYVPGAQNAVPFDPATSAIQQAIGGAYDAVLSSDDVRRSAGFVRFSNQIVFSMFATFLLPLWCLSFATEGLGREREGRNLIWLLTRPVSRPAIYLAKFVALLPWCLALNLGGFALICLFGGEHGRLALQIYWPAVLWGTLAFAALFHLMGAWFRRAAIVAILYSFFLETVMGNLPGYLKRASISFYTRCLMFDRAHDFGLQPERPAIYIPVSGPSAAIVLGVLTATLLLIGTMVFSRSEYLDLT